ncbi:hypothetical protein E2C01_099723 [Portunus trituberculatus]|uniref:Uncharacterized protein n=1 Tax=Portunus trituberculatus TaxID=210409 RepID=A0A5B7KBG0_PORTR|nr:hypothetical protein [Portunus trituberculatus]
MTQDANQRSANIPWKRVAGTDKRESYKTPGNWVFQPPHHTAGVMEAALKKVLRLQKGAQEVISPTDYHPSEGIYPPHPRHLPRLPL